ncbi:MAG TPA: SDR family NAD(P)-dependent oxidoreductase [Planctomycetota bacterium]|nr:SDR family NAD(P)-dependent oxidoreductase [Planctomycetota bacterium]
MIAIDLSGKLALVTGASGELGRVITRTLARAGADVAIHYNQNKAKADELLAEIKPMGRRAMIVQADVTDADSIGRMKDAVLKELGEPDIIVNNAVIQYNWTTVLEPSSTCG